MAFLTVYGRLLKVTFSAALRRAGTLPSCVVIVLAIVGPFGSIGSANAEYVSTEEKFFNSAADAQNSCQARPAVYVCNPDGSMYQSYCNGNPQPGPGGITRMARVEWSKSADGGQCYYTYYANLRYTYYSSKDAGCPAGTTFVGPAATDCTSTSFTTTTSTNQKGCGGGGGQCPTGDSGSTPAPTNSSNGSSLTNSDMVGNPINASVGNKVQREVDIASAGTGVPTFARTYNSFQLRELAGLGVGWTHNWSKRLEVGASISVVRGDGSSEQFSGSGLGFWTGDPDTKLRLEATATGYNLTTQDGTVETYNSLGLLIGVRAPNGSVTVVDQTPGYIVSVTGPYGHKLTFNWAAGRLASMKDAAGNTITFTVDGNNNLTSVGYPDNTTRTYLYESSFLTHGLTGIIDGTGSRISTYTYDPATFLATTTQRAGGTNLYTITFSGAVGYIQDALGRIVTKVRSRLFGVNKATSVANNLDSKTVTKSYDSAGNVASVTNEEGQTTQTAYDAVNRVISETRASGTPLAQTTQTTYADAFAAIPSTVTEPSVRSGSVKTTTFVYADARFPLLPTSVTVAGFTPSGVAVSRTTGLAYSSTGQLALIDGPRSDVIDTTTIETWQCTTGGSCGQLKRITNALGQQATFDTYDGAGRLLQKTSASGIVTSYTYNARGKALSVTETGGVLSRSIAMTYDGASRLATAQLPTGQTLSYAYDGADQLLSITDQLGNTVAYGYDLKGNRTSVTVKDGGGNIATQATMVYNARNAVQSISAAGGTTNIVSDALGNPMQVTDPTGKITNNQFDALNRQWKSINALAGVTTGAFTPAGDLAQLTTPNGAAFNYTVDDLGNQLKEVGPDRGTVSMSYDAAGNLKVRTDGRGVTVNYGYDVINRPTQVTYPSGIENTTYTYDSCSAGRLCSVTDASGTHAFQYDGLGRQSQEVWTASSALGGHVFTTSYTWTSFDAQATITAPSGRVVSYSYDSIGRVLGATSGAQTLVSGRSYRADGALTSQTFGNGVAEARGYDTAGRLGSWTIGSIETRTYGRDLIGNITSITYGGAARNYGYDAINRLTSEPGQSFGWDGNGNRTSDATGSYSYTSSTNRLTASPVGSVGIDAAGNTTMVGARTYTYSDEGRLNQVLNGGAVVGTYRYRADRLRASKTTGSGTTLFHWDAAGNLLEETNTAGVATRGYAWLNSVPIAQWTGTGPVLPLYLHADHLGTPRLGTGSAGAVAWRWDGAAFGTVSPTGSVQVNLRFPGQYYDSESGLYQNWHRDYDQSIGRYIQSDPIGLEGGINTYAYTYLNPVSYADPKGLFVPLVIVGVCAAGGCEAAGAVLAAGAIWWGIQHPVVTSSEPMYVKPPRSKDPAADAAHDAYKDEYNKPPPPGLDPCEFLKWKLAREKAIQAARMAFDAKFGAPWHTQAILDGGRAIKNIEAAIRNTPGCTCP